MENKIIEILRKRFRDETGNESHQDIYNYADFLESYLLSIKPAWEEVVYVIQPINSEKDFPPSLKVVTAYWDDNTATAHVFYDAEKKEWHYAFEPDEEDHCSEPEAWLKPLSLKSLQSEKVPYHRINDKAEEYSKSVVDDHGLRENARIDFYAGARWMYSQSPPPQQLSEPIEPNKSRSQQLSEDEIEAICQELDLNLHWSAVQDLHKAILSRLTQTDEG